jgi:hypothetical protein
MSRAGESENKISDSWIARVEALEEITKAVTAEMREIAARLKAVEEGKKAKS